MAAIREREGKIRARLKAGSAPEEVAGELAEELGPGPGAISRALKAALPDLDELVATGKKSLRSAQEAAILADYRSGMLYDKILKKHHVGTLRLREIISKYGRRARRDLGRAQKEANLRRYQEAVGTVVNGLRILEILPARYGKPPRCLVECESCGARFTETAYRAVIRRQAACGLCEKEEKGQEGFGPDAGVPVALAESGAKITCVKTVAGCCLSEVLKLCCLECSFFKKGKCRHNRCMLDYRTCGFARERKIR